MRRALRVVWVLALVVGCTVYLLSCVAPFVHPHRFPLLGIIGLGFPLCVAGMVVLLWVSFFVSRRQAIAITVCLLLGSYNIYNYVSFFPSVDKTPDGYKELSIMTWNVKNFNLYSWTNNTHLKDQMLALIKTEDPDVLLPPANPQPFVHWVIYNIPATAQGLPANLPIDPTAAMPPAIAGAMQGPSGFRRPIYRGPAPPPGKPHHYHFIVYALDVAGLPSGLTRAQLTDAMAGHIVGQGQLVATYERKPPTPGR